MDKAQVRFIFGGFERLPCFEGIEAELFQRRCDRRSRFELLITFLNIFNINIYDMFISLI
jgi:hypothetical protein